MKTNKLLLCFAIIAVIPFLDSCKKYEDGPAFSLSSKKARVANIWKLDKVFDITTGTFYTSDFIGQYIEFKKDGTFISTDSSSSIIGSWVFASDNENILLTENGSSDVVTFQIRRLTEKEFWYRDDIGTNHSWEYHLAPK